MHFAAWIMALQCKGAVIDHAMQMIGRRLEILRLRPVGFARAARREFF